jgi:hypothetical protein
MLPSLLTLVTLWALSLLPRGVCADRAGPKKIRALTDRVNHVNG